MSSVGLGYIRKDLLVNETAAGTAYAADCQGTSNISVYLKGAGTISSGSIIIETADYPVGGNTLPGYTGTWSQVGATIAASTLTAGQQTMVILPQGAYSHVRVRISVVIGGGGSVSATLLAV